MNFDHILLAADISDPCGVAFEFAAYQAKMTGAKVTVLNILEPFQIPPELRRVIWNPDRLENMEETYLKSARETLEKLVDKHMHGQKTEIVSLVSEKSAGQSLSEYADEKEVDLIVMASHGHGVIGQLLLGSTVQKVLASANCPVLVIPRDRVQI